MKFLIAAANGTTIIASMVCMSYLYRNHWRGSARTRLVGTVVIIGVTLLVTTLQYFFAGVVPAFQRDLHALIAGEWWRLISPLFVQPSGWGQCLFNGIFLIVFVPLSERLYGAGIWLIYFGSGIVGQLANYAWRPEGGGSSTAAFGTMGSLLLWIVWHRRMIPIPYCVIALIGIGGAVGLCLIRDGHGPGFLAGVVLASTLVSRRKTPRQSLQRNAGNRPFADQRCPPRP
jgi:rhomboid protease GluP